MDVVTGAMATLLPKLGDLLTEEYQLQTSVQDDVAFLKSDLESMEAALLKISEAAPIDVQDNLWAREVRELSYHIEDCVDTFVARVDRPPGKLLQGLRGFIDRGLDLLRRAKVRHEVCVEIRDIKRRIMEVSERRVRYKVDDNNVVVKSSGQTVDSLRLSALYAKATELVGTEDRSDELVDMLLMESKRQLRIVSIVGFGGFGKTTLAKVVYEKLKGNFDCGALVSVSHNPSMEKVFRNMLYQLNKDCNINVADLGEALLTDELRKFLRNKSYFIIVDDVWSCSAWNTIKYALIENECGSRVITTTRILGDAKQANVVYQLKPLSLAESRKLFHHRIFGAEDKCPNQLAQVSDKILKKCGGVPLALITISGMLADTRNEATEKYWYQVYQSMGLGLDESQDVKDMRTMLSVSYYDLPPHLKTCLLYLALFSEDYGIIRQDVIWKWIGEGFIQKKHGKTLYEQGEDYFGDLINRSMIQPLLMDHGSRVWSCCMHDMMLDLITSLSEEENFLRTLSGSQLISKTSKIRRLSLQTSREDDARQLTTMNLSHVRSLIVSEEAFTLLPTLLSFPVIRVLDLSRCSQVDNNHCKNICNLLLLRYLRLSWTSITEIPNEIGNLQLLQILDLDMTNIKALPSTFVQLRKLEFLCIDHQTRLPECFGNLKSLQKLMPNITVRSPIILHELGKLTELRRSNIRFDEWDVSYEELFVQCLSNLVNMEVLQIFDCHNGLGFGLHYLTPGPQKLRSIIIGPNTIYRVPRWMSSLIALSNLDITLLTLGEEDLKLLGSIPSLSHLYIWIKEHGKEREKRLVIDHGYLFLCLKKFRIGPGAMEVEFALGAMTELQTLRLDFHVRHTIDQFGNFNFGLENLSSLELVVVHMNCYNAECEEVEDAEAAIREALDFNPNRPKLELEKSGCSWKSD